MAMARVLGAPSVPAAFPVPEKYYEAVARGY